MVTHVRIDEVIASIAVSSGGTGRASEETVVRDLERAIGATEHAARDAIDRAVKFQYVDKGENGTVFVIKEDL